jgi:hypothetical protein
VVKDLSVIGDGMTVESGATLSAVRHPDEVG